MIHDGDTTKGEHDSYSTGVERIKKLTNIYRSKPISNQTKLSEQDTIYNTSAHNSKWHNSYKIHVTHLHNKFKTLNSMYVGHS